jgi:hypothetical protein
MMATALHLWATIKTAGWKLLLPIFTLLLPIKWVMLLVGICIIIDTGFGLWAAKRTGKKITSSRFSSVISKMLVYQLVIITFYGIDVVILGDFVKLFIGIPLVITKLTAIVLISVEGFSVDEKLKNVNGPDKGIWFYIKRLLGVAKLIKKEAGDLTEEINTIKNTDK